MHMVRTAFRWASMLCDPPTRRLEHRFAFGGGNWNGGNKAILPQETKQSYNALAGEDEA
jgi:hypothetical protein